MPRVILPALAHVSALVLLLVLTGCAEEKVYDWQRPHDTYQVGAFSKAANAEALKAALNKNGYDSRVETEIINGVFYLNVLVDVYDNAPDTLARLEKISGTKPISRGKRRSDPTAPRTPSQTPPQTP